MDKLPLEIVEKILTIKGLMEHYNNVVVEIKHKKQIKKQIFRQFIMDDIKHTRNYRKKWRWMNNALKIDEFIDELSDVGDYNALFRVCSNLEPENTKTQHLILRFQCFQNAFDKLLSMSLSEREKIITQISLDTKTSFNKIINIFDFYINDNRKSQVIDEYNDFVHLSNDVIYAIWNALDNSYNYSLTEKMARYWISQMVYFTDEYYKNP